VNAFVHHSRSRYGYRLQLLGAQPIAERRHVASGSARIHDPAAKRAACFVPSCVRSGPSVPPLFDLVTADGSAPRRDSASEIPVIARGSRHMRQRHRRPEFMPGAIILDRNVSGDHSGPQWTGAFKRFASLEWHRVQLVSPKCATADLAASMSPSTQPTPDRATRVVSPTCTASRPRPHR
jgi:hypothetical protein